jgi:hypothetical protein
MGLRTKTVIERDPFTGNERDVEVPRIDYREQEREDGTTLVYDVVEQLKFIMDQYGKLLPAHVHAETTRVINRLEQHDKKSDGHLFMLERRMSILEKRLKEAIDDGDEKTRLDIPWVRQELSMLRWMKARL